MKQSTYWLIFALYCIIINPIEAQLRFEQFVFEGYGSSFLDNASSVAVSPDDRHLYVTSFDDKALSLFDRDLNTGELVFVEAYKNDVDGLSGLGGTQSVIVAPDGRHVYASGQDENSLLVFERNEVDGRLIFVEKLTDNVGGLSGMQGATKIKSSADGNQIYLVSPNDDAVSVFTRNVVTGELSQLQLIEDGGNGGNHMTYPLNMVVSPDGKHVYVSSFGDDAISIFLRDEANGSLTYLDAMVNGVAGVSGLSGANGVTVSPDGKYVFATGEKTVVVFQRASSTGNLSFLGQYTDGIEGSKLEGIEALGMSKTGRYLYTFSTYEDAITIFEMNQINGSMVVIEEIKNGNADITGLEFPRAVAFTQNNEEMYVACFGGNSLLHFDVDNEFGELDYNSTLSSDMTTGLAGIEGAKTVAVSPDNQHVYVGGELDDALVIFERDATSGMLQYLAMIEDGGANDGINGIRSITLSPDGQHVYAAGFWDSSVAIFQRDATTGLLSYLGRVKDGLFGSDGLSGVSSVIVSPDGMHVYTAAYLENGIGVFNRNTSNGMLSFEEVYFDGVLGVDGLEGVVDLSISADGQFVYAAGKNENALAVFQRDASAGTLTFIESLEDGQMGVDGIAGITAITISADGQHLYTSSEADNAVTLFNRNITTGTLSLIAIYQDVAAGGTVEGLNGASDLVLNAEGNYLYTSAFSDNAVTVFSRDMNSGVLVQQQIAVNGEAQVNGIDGTTSVGVSPDGKHIYATGFNEGGVGIFSCTIEEELVITICEGESYMFGGEELTSPGNYEYVNDTDACVIISKLNLSVSVLNSYLEVEICAGEEYQVGTETYNETGYYTQTLTTNQGCDSIINLDLAVVSEFTPIMLQATVCNGETYDLGNNTYTESGSYEMLFSSQSGCDSLVQLELEVLPMLVDTFDIAACEDGFYVFGTSNYVADGTYSQLFQSGNGCDSMVTINLEFVPTTYYLEETICEGEVYMLGDDAITDAGNYEGEVVLNSGCEVSVNLVLSVLPVGSSTIEAVICEGDYFVFNNNPYTETGMYQAAYPTPNGCDSIVTLDLIVYPTEVNVEETICEGESYEVGNISFTESGDYEVMLDSYNGCDSMVFVALTVIPQEDEIEAFICDGGAYALGNEVYTETGVYTQTILDASGCETVVTLNLEELNPIEVEAEIANDNGIGNGAIDLTVTGGQAPYTYQWSNGATSEDLENLSEGMYAITITDNQGCESVLDLEVAFSTSVANISQATMQLYLVPSLVTQGASIQLQIESPIAQEGQLRILDNIGQVIEKQDITLQRGQNSRQLTAPNINGMYYVQLSFEGNMETLRFNVAGK